VLRAVEQKREEGLGGRGGGGGSAGRVGEGGWRACLYGIHRRTYAALSAYRRYQRIYPRYVYIGVHIADISVHIADISVYVADISVYIAVYIYVWHVWEHCTDFFFRLCASENDCMVVKLAEPVANPLKETQCRCKRDLLGSKSDLLNAYLAMEGNPP
jgi:hypothetical protein